MPTIPLWLAGVVFTWSQLTFTVTWSGPVWNRVPHYEPVTVTMERVVVVGSAENEDDCLEILTAIDHHSPTVVNVLGSLVGLGGVRDLAVDSSECFDGDFTLRGR